MTPEVIENLQKALWGLSNTGLLKFILIVKDEVMRRGGGGDIPLDKNDKVVKVIIVADGHRVLFEVGREFHEENTAIFDIPRLDLTHWNNVQIHVLLEGVSP